MKFYSLLSLFTLLFLSSCTSVYFDRPQPKGGQRLSSVPEELQGTWIDKYDTVYMRSQELLRVSTELDSMDNIVDVAYYSNVLSDSVRLYKAGNHYVANIQDPEKGWEILVIEREADGDIFWYYPLEAPFLKQTLGLRIKKVERSKSIETADSTYTEKFTNKSIKVVEGENIDAIFYKGQFKIKHIPSIIRPGNVYWQWNANGTIGEEEEEY